MQNLSEWVKEVFDEELPEVINGTWFEKHHLPMIVCCCCCQMTLVLPNARIDKNDDIFCGSCAETLSDVL